MIEIRCNYSTSETLAPAGVNTTTASIDDILRAAKEIYKDYPEILKALGL